MSTSQAKAFSPPTGKTDKKYPPRSRRYTPLRSYVIARALSHGTDRDLAQSPLVPTRRLRHSA